MSDDQVENAKKMPEIYYARHMKPGVAAYEDQTIYVGVDAMKRMCKSFDAKPVYVMHQTVDIETVENADGYVTECFYNELDGYLWAKMIVKTDAGHEAIARGDAVSNAYVPKEWAGAGTCNSVPYDREVMNGQFTHLAIVPDPRYEDAIIMTPDEYKAYTVEKKGELEELQNSKNKKGKYMFWKKQKIESAENIEDTMVELKNGQSIALADMIAEVENGMKKNEEDDKDMDKEKMNMDYTLTVGEEKMTVGELMNRYTEMMESQNAAKEAEKKAKEDEKMKEQEKKNSKFSDELKNAKKAATEEKKAPVVEGLGARLKRGSERY